MGNNDGGGRGGPIIRGGRGERPARGRGRPGRGGGNSGIQQDDVQTVHPLQFTVEESHKVTRPPQLEEESHKAAHPPQLGEETHKVVPELGAVPDDSPELPLRRLLQSDPNAYFHRFVLKVLDGER